MTDHVVTLTTRQNILVGMTGTQGPQGAGGSGGGADSHFTFNQGIASASWSINHNLGKFPSISVVDSAGHQGFGSVRYVDANNLVVSFAAPFAGTAYLN